MSAILSAFGIDWRLLIVYSVNFGILLAILWYFLYEPLVGMLEKRRSLVAQGVIDAQNAEKRLKEVEASEAKKLAAAGREADAILSNARKTAVEKERELLSQGEAAAMRIVTEAKTQAREAKEQALAEAHKEVAKLVVLGLEKEVAKRS